MNLFLAILAITGCCLDRKKKLVFTPVQNKGATEANSKEGKHIQVPDSSLHLRDSVVVPVIKKPHETEMKQASLTPSSADAEEGKSDPVSTNHIKL